MISTAVVTTDRPARYLTQLARHAAAMSGGHGSHPALPMQVEQSADRVVFRFVQRGLCVLEADETTLTIRVEAAEEAALRRIQDIVAADLGRFGRREQLSLTWRADPAGPVP
jgi:hypothetical protein